MTENIHKHRILILDFGSQYTQLVARRVRELGVYCELWAWDVTEAQIREFNPSGIILSGGPESTTEENSPRAPQYVFEAGVPVFGVCYGMQTMAMQLGGHVEGSNEREFGYAQVEVVTDSALVRGIEDSLTARRQTAAGRVDEPTVTKLPPFPSDFVTVASTESCPFAIMANEEKRFYGVQFPPGSDPHPSGDAYAGAASCAISASVKPCGPRQKSSTTPWSVSASRLVMTK
ncbi:GMP synthase [Enterobacter cancerogenus]|uniref:GMP synthase n=1 Tax=Enterobacter cancerogenus TaxID=69218 RepID=A0A484Z606_9ENTR|nr:GMP synthase [Enterobacter cancerogenus]